MVMDTRVTNAMHTGFDTDIYQITVATGARVFYSTVNNTTVTGTTGQYKSVASERDGKFIPNVFRANPCIMREAQASKLGGYALTNASAGKKYELLGDWYYHAVWNDLEKRNAIRDLFPLWNQSYADVAWVKANAKLKDVEYDMFVAIGELRETLSMLRNPISALTSATSKALKNMERARRGLLTVDAITGLWLTWRYGINPLINDIVKIIELWDKRIKQLEGLQRKAGGIRVVDEQKQMLNSTWSVFTLANQWHMRTETKTTYHIYYERLLEANRMFLLRSLGMHPSQIPAGMWELVGKSFVWDWFFLVGDWLRAIMPDPTIRYKGMCVSQKVIRHLDLDTIAVTSSLGLDPEVPVVLPYFRWHSSTMERRVGTTAVALPPFNPNFFKFARMLDSISLLWGSLTRDIKRIRKHAH